jgi:hypothetical protein
MLSGGLEHGIAGWIYATIALARFRSITRTGYLAHPQKEWAMIFEVLSLIDFPSGSHFQNLFSDSTILHRTFFSEIDLAENELLFTKSLSALAGLFYSITGSVDTCTKVLVQTLKVRLPAVSAAAQSLLAS